MLPTDPTPNLPAVAAPTFNIGQLLRATLGLCLLAVGLGIGLWVVFQAYQLFTNPGHFTLFQELKNTLSRPEYEVFPSEIWLYGLPILLLSIIVSFANSLITNGVQLINGNLDELKRTLTSKIDDLQQQIKKS